MSDPNIIQANCYVTLCVRLSTITQQNSMTFPGPFILISHFLAARPCCNERVLSFISCPFCHFTSLAFQVHAPPFVNNWWCPAACLVSNAATDVWAAGTRWQRAPTRHTNMHTHTHEQRYESLRLFPHSLHPLTRPPSQEIVSNNNERWALEARYCTYQWKPNFLTLCTLILPSSDKKQIRAKESQVDWV